MHSLPDPNRFKGQALLVVLLVMAVALTTVLSIASRSITDISTTRLEEESLRAFSAAEAGVEEALKNPEIGTRSGNIGDTSEDTPQTAEYVINVTTPVVDSREFLHPSKLHSGESATFWFVGHDAAGNMSCSGTNCYTGVSTSSFNVCWGNPGTQANNSNSPAIELAVFYDTTKNSLNGDYSNLNVARAVYDPNNARRTDNNFSSSSGCSAISGIDLSFSTGDLRFTNLGIPGPCVTDDGCLLLTKVKSLYNTNPHQIGIRVADNNLPSQGIQVESVGTFGESTRRLDVYQTYPEIPTFLENAVFSLNNLSK